MNERGQPGLDGDSAAWVLGQPLFGRRVFDVKAQQIWGARVAPARAWAPQFVVIYGIT